jgi:hypothetical protein
MIRIFISIKISDIYQAPSINWNLFEYNNKVECQRRCRQVVAGAALKKQTHLFRWAFLSNKTALIKLTVHLNHLMRIDKPFRADPGKHL